MSGYSFGVKKNRAGEWMAHFSYNGEYLFWSEAYPSKARSLQVIDTLKREVASAPVETMND